MENVFFRDLGACDKGITSEIRHEVVFCGEDVSEN